MAMICTDWYYYFHINSRMYYRKKRERKDGGSMEEAFEDICHSLWPNKSCPFRHLGNLKCHKPSDLWQTANFFSLSPRSVVCSLKISLHDFFLFYLLCTQKIINDVFCSQVKCKCNQIQEIKHIE